VPTVEEIPNRAVAKLAILGEPVLIDTENLLANWNAFYRFGDMEVYPEFQTVEIMKDDFGYLLIGKDEASEITGLLPLQEKGSYLVEQPVDGLLLCAVLCKGYTIDQNCDPERKAKQGRFQFQCIDKNNKRCLTSVSCSERSILFTTESYM